MGWRGWTSVATRHKEEVVPKKKTLFCQEEKDVPDLLESIMRPTDPVKEELTA